jgi:hypothetical protein
MTTDYRALCAELLSEAIYLGSVPSAFPPSPELVARARALLAQPVPEGPEGSYFTDGDYNREIHYAWELEDAEGEWQAGGSSNRLDDVRREGSHCLQTYSQDGPHKLIIQRHCVSTIEEVTND